MVDGVRLYVRINPDGYELVGRPATEYRPIDVIALNQLRAAKRSSTYSMQIPTDDGSVTEEEAANFTNEANEHLKKFEVVSLFEIDFLNGLTNIHLFSRS